MAKDVNIHIKTPGAEEAQQNLDRTAQAAQQMGGKVQDAGRQAQAGGAGVEQFGKQSDEAGRLSQGLSRAVDAMKRAILGLIGIQGLWVFFNKWLSYIRETNQASVTWPIRRAT